MAVLRKREIKTLAQNEMKEKLLEIRRELMSEYSKVSSGGVPNNPGKLPELRKTIARIKTIAGEKGQKINE